MTQAPHPREPAGNGAERPRLGRLHVLIADHDGLARSMMRDALHAVKEVGMVTTAGDGRETFDLARYYRPGVLVLETALPPAGGVDLITKVLDSTPQTRVVTVSVSDDEAALAALRAGAIGHIDKDVAPQELAQRVIRAADGEAVIPERLITRLLELVREVPDTGWRPLRSRLTTREWEIIELIDQETSTQDIAERLVLSPTTVYSHVKNVMRKLGVHSRHDAVTAAERLRHQEAWGEKTPTDSRQIPPQSPPQTGNTKKQRAYAGSR